MGLIPPYAFRACSVSPLPGATRAVQVTGPCHTCSAPQAVAVEPTDLEKFRQGGYVQDCFSYLSADEREFLLSGICSKCWQDLFGSEDEDDDEEDSYD